MKKTFLDELLNSGIIDSEPSTINPRQFIYYPLIESSSTDNAFNNNDKDKKASFPSNLNKFDHLSYSNFRIYEKITKNLNEEQIFYELMQLLSHRIDFHEIKEPFADHLNNNEKFQIVDNKKSVYNNDSQLRSNLNKLNSNFHIKNELFINNTK